MKKLFTLALFPLTLAISPPLSAEGGTAGITGMTGMAGTDDASKAARYAKQKVVYH